MEIDAQNDKCKKKNVFRTMVRDMEGEKELRNQ